MNFIPPDAVTSPRLRWSLIAVLDPGNGEATSALALGRWEGDPCLGIRWNGTNDNNPVGSPQSRGIPTWHILPHGRIEDAIIGTLPPDKQTLVRSIMAMKPRT